MNKIGYIGMSHLGLNMAAGTALKGCKVFCYDLINDLSDGLKKEIGNDIDYIVHMAAETHVDRSIDSPKNFDYKSFFFEMIFLKKNLINLFFQKNTK